MAIGAILQVLAFGGALAGLSLRSRKRNQISAQNFGSTLAALGPGQQLPPVNVNTGAELAGPPQLLSEGTNQLTQGQIQAAESMYQVDQAAAIDYVKRTIGQNIQAQQFQHNAALQQQNLHRSWAALDLQAENAQLRRRELAVTERSLSNDTRNAFASKGYRTFTNDSGIVDEVAPLRGTTEFEVRAQKEFDAQRSMSETADFLESMFAHGGIVSPDDPAYTEQQLGLQLVLAKAREALNTGVLNSPSEQAMVAKLVSDPNSVTSALLRGDSATVAGINALLKTEVREAAQRRRLNANMGLPGRDTAQAVGELSRSARLSSIADRLRAQSVLSPIEGGNTIDVLARQQGFSPSARDRSLIVERFKRRGGTSSFSIIEALRGAATGLREATPSLPSGLNTGVGIPVPGLK